MDQYDMTITCISMLDAYSICETMLSYKKVNVRHLFINFVYLYITITAIITISAIMFL